MSDRLIMLSPTAAVQLMPVYFTTGLYGQEQKQSSHFRMLCKEHKSVFGCIGITVFLYLLVTSFGQSYSVTASFPASAVNIWHLQLSSDMRGPSFDSSSLLKHIAICSFHISADKKMCTQTTDPSAEWTMTNSFLKPEARNHFFFCHFLNIFLSFKRELKSSTSKRTRRPEPHSHDSLETDESQIQLAWNSTLNKALYLCEGLINMCMCESVWVITICLHTSQFALTSHK